MYGHTSLDNLHVHVHVIYYTVGQLAFSLYFWPSLKVFILSMHGITCSTCTLYLALITANSKALNCSTPSLAGNK